jgi:catechol 2,3-dioxygenase-like lactoylglutathione lyase family enzyme
MLGAQAVIGFIPTKDFGRAKEFFRDKVGLRFTGEEDQFALVFESAGVMIRVVKVSDFTPAGFTILGWRVKKIEETVAAMQQRGVKFERFPGMKQDALGIWTAPSRARVAWFKDPDGNVLSVSQHG